MLPSVGGGEPTDLEGCWFLGEGGHVGSMRRPCKTFVSCCSDLAKGVCRANGQRFRKAASAKTRRSATDGTVDVAFLARSALAPKVSGGKSRGWEVEMSKLMERRREKVAAAVAEYLREGETVQAAIFAQNKGSGAFAAFGAAAPLTMKYYWVVATNERIVVFNASATGVTKVTGVDRELPRETQIGPPNGKGSLTRLLYGTAALGQKVFIPRPYWGEVKAADAARVAP